MVLMLVSGIFLVRMSSTEGDIAYGTMWAEGSFFAADAGVNVGVDTVVPGGPTCVRSSTSLGHPLEAVTARKAARLRRLAAAWIQDRRVHPAEVRIDLVGVLRPARGAAGVEHVRGVA